MTCHHAPQVHAYHDGQLPLAQRSAVEGHIAGCEPCSALLNDLREISLRVRAAPLPDGAAIPFERLYDSWRLTRQHGVLRITHWLTAAAAAVLAAALIGLPDSGSNDTNPITTASTSSWEAVALMAPVVEDNQSPGEELIEVAQWMADDLAAN